MITKKLFIKTLHVKNKKQHVTRFILINNFHTIDRALASQSPVIGIPAIQVLRVLQ